VLIEQLQTHHEVVPVPNGLFKNSFFAKARAKKKRLIQRAGKKTAARRSRGPEVLELQCP
jgi:hypothetical protein